MSLAKAVPALIGGSALAGFGAAVGKDVYLIGKKKKNDFIIIFLILLVTVGPVFGVFYSGYLITLYSGNASQILRNFILSLFILAISNFIGAVVFMIIAVLLVTSPTIEFLTITDHPIGYSFEYYTTIPMKMMVGDQIVNYGEPLRQLGSTSTKLLLIALIFVAGFAVGVIGRAKRRRLTEAQDHNVRFMANIGLLDLGQGRFRDQAGNDYRYEGRSDTHLQLFAVGRRNRRAYLSINEDGKFTDWSGLVKIGR